MVWKYGSPTSSVSGNKQQRGAWVQDPQLELVFMLCKNNLSCYKNQVVWVFVHKCIHGWNEIITKESKY